MLAVFENIISAYFALLLPWLPIMVLTGYGDDVIGKDRKLKNELPNKNFSQITMQKELGRYLLLVLRKKKYKTVRHSEK